MQKGFTLVELIATILILAIVSLITVPVVINVVDDAKKSASLNSAKMYIRAINNEIAKRKINGFSIANGVYNISSDGNLCLNVSCTNKLELDFSGKKPSNGTIEISNSSAICGYNMQIEKKLITCDSNKELIVQDN